MLPEDMPVRGNCMASGDDEFDTTCENEIIERLNAGDISAWFTAKVVAEFHGLEASTYLGGCSYDSENDFVENSGCYEDMVIEVISELEGKITKLIDDLGVI